MVIRNNEKHTDLRGIYQLWKFLSKQKYKE